MNCLWRVSSYTAAIFGRAGHFVTRSALHPCSMNLDQTGLKIVNLEFLLPKFRVQGYSSKKTTVKASRKKKLDPKPSLMEQEKKLDPKPAVMEQEKDAFFIVRKGEVIGVYKSFTDCQAQVGSSICNPSVSVYKEYSLHKDAEEYLTSRGLQNALYTIRAADLKEDLFGTLVPCPFQQPTSSNGEKCALDATKKRSQELVGLQTLETDGSTSSLVDPLRKHVKLDSQSKAQAMSYDHQSCILDFGGASRGNPGPAGAGVLVRNTDGEVICRLRAGLSTATFNVAEYKAVILGLKYALKKGYTKIHVRGDSKLICSQIHGSCKVKHWNLANLYEQVKQLRHKFVSFQISYVLRKFNSLAYAQANLAIELDEGQVQEECLQL